jgi:hypothetical protein
MLLTIALICTIVGALFLTPVPNNTGYYMPMTDERRSTWMLIGLRTLNKFLED